MDTVRHVRVTERETVYDLARKEWATKVTGIQSTHVRQTGQARASSHSMSTRKAPLPAQVAQARCMSSYMLTFTLLSDSSNFHVYKDLYWERNKPEKNRKFTVELQ